MDEADVFAAIFEYVQVLLQKIRPKKIIFLAIDGILLCYHVLGVAPRAKMNQQRSRRFRAAKELQEACRKQADPSVEIFDGNCITPGTEFMDSLSRALRVLFAQFIDQSASLLAETPAIIFSGPEVPGEGEHKIMEYLRYARSQPGYDPNTRHCLYGLDADLIMLSLLSHDPHFALLREEVTFGRKGSAVSVPKTAAQCNFYLMHIGILREYLESEFSLGMAHFDLEDFIDDYVSFSVFVGNDFLPHLPFLHINENAFGLLFENYKTLDHRSKLNGLGSLNFSLLSDFLFNLSAYEFGAFLLEEGYDEASESIQKAKSVLFCNRGRLLRRFVGDFVQNERASTLECPLKLRSDEYNRIRTIAHKLNLEFTLTDEHAVLLSKRSALPVSAKKLADLLNTLLVKEDSSPELDSILAAFQNWKKRYYLAKLEVDLLPHKEALCTSELLSPILKDYLTGLQWIMGYYYEGVPSWSWFYPHHYAPFASDLAGFLLGSADFSVGFSKGRPFAPLEQLLAVLPAASYKLVPPAFASLMTDPATSPIIDFYPLEFEADLNGKKNAWEAVVKIPFIDESRLLAAMAERSSRLTRTEQVRNQFAPSIAFRHDESRSRSMVALDGRKKQTHCFETSLDIPALSSKIRVIKGLVQGATLPKHTKGLVSGAFPSLHSISYSAELVRDAKIRVFNHESKDPSLILTVESLLREQSDAESYIGSMVFVNYPFFQRARIAAVSGKSLFFCDKWILEQKAAELGKLRSFEGTRSELLSRHRKRMGVKVSSKISYVFWVVLLKAHAFERNDLCDADFDCGLLIPVLPELAVADSKASIISSAPPASEMFSVGSPAILCEEGSTPGLILEIIGHEHADPFVDSFRALVRDQHLIDPLAFGSASASILRSEASTYFTTSQAARALNISPLLLSRLTAKIPISTTLDESKGSRVSIGFGFKFEGKHLKAFGYARKGRAGNGWEYSEKAVSILDGFCRTFPSFVERLSRYERSDTIGIQAVFDLDESKLPPKQCLKEAMHKLGQIKEWIAVNGKTEPELVMLADDCEALSREAVGKLDRLLPTLPSRHFKSLTRTVSSLSILNRSTVQRIHAESSAAAFSLGDRVSCIGPTKIPFGSCGTVVGMESKRHVLDASSLTLGSVSNVGFVRVMLDHPLLGTGCDFGGQVPQSRGISIAPEEVVNLSRFHIYLEFLRKKQAEHGDRPVHAEERLLRHVDIKDIFSRDKRDALAPRQIQSSRSSGPDLSVQFRKLSLKICKSAPASSDSFVDPAKDQHAREDSPPTRNVLRVGGLFATPKSK